VLLFVKIIGATSLCNPWDASPSTLEITEPGVFGPLQLLQLAVISRWVLREAHSASPDLAAKFKGKKSRERNGWRRGRDRGGKGRDIGGDTI